MNESSIRLVLVIPSWVIRMGLNQIISENAGLEVVESVGDLSGISSRHLAGLRADAVVLDPSAASAAGIQSLREYYESLKDCTLIGAINAAYSQEILDQFDTFFTINDNPGQIVRKIRDYAASERLDETPKDGDQNVLSSREKEILSEVAQGLTNKEIADKLNISVFTVTTHRKNISQKLGIRSIAGLTVYAVMNHIIDEKQLL